ncbi:hypothetical protein L3Y34_016836 [Caenorhabditis briggsae]|uniref:Uncharacterized protein n=1 Tax=Caenorhabditis briggsae TaxID=6238 RepID=A0AAE9DHB4_CAEBR|nr:hypothetical protein L3Y34_016836 [Caenorhabditis briggsae]
MVREGIELLSEYVPQTFLFTLIFLLTSSAIFMLCSGKKDSNRPPSSNSETSKHSSLQKPVLSNAPNDVIPPAQPTRNVGEPVKPPTTNLQALKEELKEEKEDKKASSPPPPPPKKSDRKSIVRMFSKNKAQTPPKKDPIKPSGESAKKEVKEKSEENESLLKLEKEKTGAGGKPDN